MDWFHKMPEERRNVSAEALEEADLAYARWAAMLGRSHHPDAVEAQAVKDREAYSHYIVFAEQDGETVKLEPWCNLIRFMVEVCGIPLEAAEYYVICYLHAPPYLTSGTLVEVVEDAKPEEMVAELREQIKSALDVMYEARLYAMAAKGTPYAKFWNDVVRRIRTIRFTPLDTKVEAWSENPSSQPIN